MSEPPYELDEIPASEHLLANYGRLPLRFVRGQGAWLEDDQGRRFLDGLAGIAVNLLGHAHPGLRDAICAQAGRLLHTSNLFHVGPQEECARLICAHSFAERVFFCNSGAEANEACLKLVRRWGNRVHGGRKPRLIAAEGGFHGRTLGALSLTGTPKYHDGFEPLLPVDFVPYGDAEALAAAMDDDVAGLWLEPMQGEAGVRVPPPGYLARARELCDRHGTLLVFDEVQSGCGRSGHLFCHQVEGVVPDCMALAKGLAGGVPIGAMATTDALGELLGPGDHASTFGGNHLACAAAVVVLETLVGEGFLPRVRELGERLRAGLAEACGDRAVAVRGLGLLCGVRLVDRLAPKDLLLAALREGLVAGIAGDNVFRLAPPLTVDAEEVDEIVRRTGAALARVG